MEKLTERIRRLAKENGIRSIAEVERLCDFKPRTIQEWDEHCPAVDRVVKVARLFNVSTDYLLGHESEEDPLEGLKIALWGGEKGISDAQLEEVMKFAAFVKERDKQR